MSKKNIQNFLEKENSSLVPPGLVILELLWSPRSLNIYKAGSVNFKYEF